LPRLLWLKNRRREDKRRCPLYPESGHLELGRAASFDNLVGCLQEDFRDCEAKGFSGLEIDDQLVLGWELNR